MPKLGDLTPRQLIDSAREELKALEEHLGIKGKPVMDENNEPNWAVLYVTSIESRLIVADLKLRDEADARDAELVEQARKGLKV